VQRHQAMTAAIVVLDALRFPGYCHRNQLKG
jgi:hypothetical protein